MAATNQALSIEDAEGPLVRLLQLGLAVMALYGIVTGRFSIAVNGAVSLFVTFLPALLRHEFGYSMDVRLVLWIAVAVFLHTVGITGPYGRFPWYDGVTHTISAAFVAGIGYASLRAFEVHSADVDVPSSFRVVFVLVFVVAAGVFWEILEFGASQLGDLLGGRTPLVVRGVDDIVHDLLFNTVGAVLVAAWGTGYFSSLVAPLARRIGDAEDES